MNEKRSTPANGPTSAGVEAEKAFDTALFYEHSTTHGGIISSVLAANGARLTAKEIAGAIGARDPRSVTKAVETARAAGVPICASCDANAPGFYIAQSPKELAGYIGSLRRRVKAVSRTLAALEATHDRWTGQTHLDLDGGEQE